MNQIKAGSILSYLQTGISVLVTLLYTPVMIRLLGASEYGLYNTVSSVIAMIGLLNLGFGNTYIRYYSSYQVKNDNSSIVRLNGMFMTIFVVIAALVAVCGVYLANHLPFVFSNGLTDAEYPIARQLMLLLTFNLALSLPANVFTCIITAHEHFIFLKSLGVIKTVIGPLVTLPVLISGYGSVGMVLTTVIISILCDIIYAVYVICVLKEKFTFYCFEKTIFREVFSYTLLIAIHMIVDQINWNVDKILLGRFKGTASVALYSVGYSLYAHYMSIGLPIVSLFTPSVHREVAESNSDKNVLTNHLTSLFTKIGRIQYLILAPVAVGFIFFGSSFIEHWAGPKYSNAYYVALLLIIPGSIDLIQNIGIEIQRAQNLHGFRAAIYAAMALINIVLSVFLCQLYGAIGAAIGTAISLIVVQGIIINIYYHKKCHINVISFWKSILQASKCLIPPVLFGIVVRCCCSDFSLIGLLVCLAAYTMIYLISMYYLGMNEQEKDFISDILRKAFRHITPTE